MTQQNLFVWAPTVVDQWTEGAGMGDGKSQRKIVIVDDILKYYINKYADIAQTSSGQKGLKLI